MKNAEGGAVTEAYALTAQPGDIVYYPDTAGSGTLSGTYTLKEGQKFWQAAEEIFGNWNQWTEFRRADGTGYTQTELHFLEPGTVLYYEP